MDWIARLRDLPLAGLVIRNTVPVGLYEGFSPLAVQLFAREFGVDFEPVHMFKDDQAVHATDSSSGVHLPAVFLEMGRVESPGTAPNSSEPGSDVARSSPSS